jgi:signal transduction histidine kinase
MLILGKTRKARRLFDKSLTLARKDDSRLAHARTLLARSQVGVLENWEGAKEDLIEAQKELRAIGADFELDWTARGTENLGTISMVDRFSKVIEHGRKIAGALSKDEIYSTVQDALTELIRGSKSWVFDYSPENSAIFPPHPQISHELIGETRLSGKTVNWKEERALKDPQLALSGVRAALCSPVSVRGVPVSCLYAVHHRPGVAFGEEEKKLIDFIASLAGAALENAEGFTHVKEQVQRRDDFLSIASHELKTPITSLRLQLDAIIASIVDKPLNEISHKNVTKLSLLAKDQVQRLIRLINDLLEVSKLNFQRLELSIEECDIVAIVEATLARLQADLIRAHCDLKVETSEPSIIGKWDPLRLEQVIVNLVSNAMKYGARRPIEIQVNADPDHVTFSVQDHGIGIPQEKLSKIFNRFERAVSSRNYSGLGLGLYIVRQIVEAHGGKIEVSSQLAVGSCFTVSLPRSPSTSHDPQS